MKQKYAENNEFEIFIKNEDLKNEINEIDSDFYYSFCKYFVWILLVLLFIKEFLI